VSCAGDEISTHTTDPEDRAMPINLRNLFPDSALIFFLRLLGRLQSLGTVPAMDLREYGRALER
jgi:predicted Zn-dependent peptidase